MLTFGGLAWFLNRNRHLDPRDPVGSRATPADEHRVLVVANETVAGRKLHEAVRRAVVGRPAQVLVVSPALNSPLRHFVSDEGNARREAQERLDRSLEALATAGIDARGEVGDADPLQAIDDSLRTFGADEIIISTHPEGRSNWLEKGVVSGAKRALHGSGHARGRRLAGRACREPGSRDGEPLGVLTARVFPRAGKPLGFRDSLVVEAKRFLRQRLSPDELVSG